MKVGFDISQLAHKGGVATYTENLSQELVKCLDIEMTFFYSSLRKPYKGNLPGVKEFKIPPTLFEVLFNKLRNVDIEKFIGQVDIFHSSDWVQPPSKALKITTYHDVIPLKYPEWSHPKIIAVHKKRLKIVEKEIDMIIAVSESTKNDLLEISNIPESKIVVVYEAADKIYKPQPEGKIRSFRKKYSLPGQFILSIGGIGSRRNLDNVKRAVGEYKLIVTGETLPWMNSSELALLYSSASCLLYPSFYEGFGLPILEAMSCGTPVITSDVSAMPEIGGSAPLYVDPNDVSDISEKIKIVMNDENTRNNLIAKGLERAKDFSWEKTANETIKVYQKLLS